MVPAVTDEPRVLIVSNRQADRRQNNIVRRQINPGLEVNVLR
jgi:hypothetical protein